MLRSPLETEASHHAPAPVPGRIQPELVSRPERRHGHPRREPSTTRNRKPHRRRLGRGRARRGVENLECAAAHRPHLEDQPQRLVCRIVPRRPHEVRVLARRLDRQALGTVRPGPDVVGRLPPTQILRPHEVERRKPGPARNTGQHHHQRGNNAQNPSDNREKSQMTLRTGPGDRVHAPADARDRLPGKCLGSRRLRPVSVTGRNP